ncbi:hypothetical protein D3C73_1220850 [compost metagenome]
MNGSSMPSKPMVKVSTNWSGKGFVEIPKFEESTSAKIAVLPSFPPIQLKDGKASQRPSANTSSGTPSINTFADEIVPFS